MGLSYQMNGITHYYLGYEYTLKINYLIKLYNISRIAAKDSTIVWVCFVQQEVVNQVGPEYGKPKLSKQHLLLFKIIYLY